MTRTADYGGKDGTRGIVSGETGLAHTRSIVHYKRSNLIVAHLLLLIFVYKPLLVDTT